MLAVSAAADDWELEAITQEAEALIQDCHNRFPFNPKLQNQYIDETQLDMTSLKNFAGYGRSRICWILRSKPENSARCTRRTGNE
jgi:hypothetical protein